MDDLVTWLRAQLDGDERLISEYEAYMAARATEAGSYVLGLPPGWQSGEPFDTERMRREVEAKRRILDEYERYAAERRRAMGGWESRKPSPILVALALPYADRSGYRPEWAA